jgi:hypothetical protein
MLGHPSCITVCGDLRLEKLEGMEEEMSEMRELLQRKAAKTTKLKGQVCLSMEVATGQNTHSTPPHSA